MELFEEGMLIDHLVHVFGILIRLIDTETDLRITS